MRNLSGGRAASPRVTPVFLDVTDESSIDAAVATVSSATGGRLDATVNNAGINVDGPLELINPDDLRELFAVNVLGPVAVTRATAPLLRATGGRIVNIGGAAGRSTSPFHGAMSASKAALDSLSDAWRMEFLHQGIAVTYIEPGAIDTPFFRKSAERSGRHEGLVHDLYASATEHATHAMTASSPSPILQTWPPSWRRPVRLAAPLRASSSVARRVGCCRCCAACPSACATT